MEYLNDTLIKLVRFSIPIFTLDALSRELVNKFFSTVLTHVDNVSSLSTSLTLCVDNYSFTLSINKVINDVLTEVVVKVGNFDVHFKFIVDKFFSTFVNYGEDGLNEVTSFLDNIFKSIKDLDFSRSIKVLDVVPRKPRNVVNDLKKKLSNVFSTYLKLFSHVYSSLDEFTDFVKRVEEHVENSLNKHHNDLTKLLLDVYEECRFICFQHNIVIRLNVSSLLRNFDELDDKIFNRYICYYIPTDEHREISVSLFEHTLSIWIPCSQEGKFVKNTSTVIDYVSNIFRDLLNNPYFRSFVNKYLTTFSILNKLIHGQ